MSEVFDKLIIVLEKSVEKNGADKPVTLGHLLNIAKMANRLQENEENRIERNEQEALNEMFDDMHKYGTHD